MKKSRSIYKINGEVTSKFCQKLTNSEEKTLNREKSIGPLVIAHVDFGKDDDEQGFDKNSLKYKLRKAIRTYFTRKVNEKIEKFTRGDTMFEEKDDKDLTSDTVTQRFF
jgi:hypothetical protein